MSPKSTDNAKKHFRSTPIYMKHVCCFVALSASTASDEKLWHIFFESKLMMCCVCVCFVLNNIRSYIIQNRLCIISVCPVRHIVFNAKISDQPFVVVAFIHATTQEARPKYTAHTHTRFFSLLCLSAYHFIV